MKEIGVEETARTSTSSPTLLIDGVDDELGGRVVTPRDPARAGPARRRRLDATSARSSRRSSDEGIVTSCRDGNLRISAHCYNSGEDVDAVLAALARHRELWPRPSPRPARER